MQLRLISLALLACLPTSVCWSDPVDPAQAIAQKFYEADQPVQPPPLTKRAQSMPVAKSANREGRPGRDYEMDMLRRARAEEAERQKEDSQKAVLTVTQPAPPAIIQPAAALLPRASVQPEPYQAEPAVLSQAAVKDPIRADIAQATKSETFAEIEARATILIVLNDDDSIRAHVKPDPIICFDQKCWISNGLTAPAKPMPRSEALALKTTETAMGDSCSGKSGCAFRDIAFNPTTRIEVVEVGESRGVTDGAYTIEADMSCRKHDGALTCDNALATHDYRMWVVPETTAQAVGPSGLEEAVVDGLQDDGANVEDGK